ncbi:MAG: hypothetical protein IT244_01580 [Bacteroidia bacterium]|nr:hypothetical protein [Bacteroidia bacterium]
MKNQILNLQPPSAPNLKSVLSALKENGKLTDPQNFLQGYFEKFDGLDEVVQEINLLRTLEKTILEE